MFKAGDHYKRLESKTGLCYLFLNKAKTPKITTDAIIPAMPSVSFVWNRNADPIKTAEDTILPESIAFDFCFMIPDRFKHRIVRIFRRCARLEQ